MVKVLVLGAGGMLGNAVFRYFAESQGLEVVGTLRSGRALSFFSESHRRKLLTHVDVENFDSLSFAFAAAKPDVVVKCIGLVKQLACADDPLQAIPINALLPHRLARLADVEGARLIHVSTDCVFSGSRGGYKITDFPDANDLYGRSKYLGEVVDCSHVITLRTSIIGHELDGNHGLVNWFLSQEGVVRGFTIAIFSGVPTVESARVIRDFVLPNQQLHGLYQVASLPINKNNLLHLLKSAYGKAIDIVPDSQVVIDRSLDGVKFHEATGYLSPEWTELVAKMHEFG
jgi:dTDP-4-dehydrorhamnose reductase